MCRVKFSLCYIVHNDIELGISWKKVGRGVFVLVPVDMVEGDGCFEGDS